MDSKVNILLVDDRPENLLALESILENPEYRLVKAHSGRESLKWLLQEEFAVIILDVRMTDLDGFETAALLRERDQSRHTPIIFLTAYSQDREHILRGYSLGAVDYLFTPAEPEILRAKVAVFVDLFKKTRELKHQTALLTAAKQELESFCYSVSHDLRAPLRHIDGFVAMLRRESEPALGDACLSYLDTISESALRMDKLINGLLAFSRMSRTEVLRRPLEMDELVKEVLRDLARETAGRNITWQVAPLPSVLGDRSLLRQVWGHLLGNAVKYSRSRDPATIQVGGRMTGEEFEFHVRDNGAGFDMRHVDKLFGVFQRLHRPDEFEGTGISLACVRRIIARHGGRTWANGELNMGATFYFTLPISQSKSP